MPLAKDTLFEISDFNVPKMISGADAWVEIILNLLFLENGTYSDAPELGLDLKAHTYMESQELVNYVSNGITDQTENYMPQIPLTNVSVIAKPMDNGDTVLYITLSFSFDNNVVTKEAFVSLNDEIVDEIVSHF
jgi:hypothetical protein